jgi:flavin-dependent dehydrogenase
VIGGGPAGSTVAPLLVEQGFRVAVLEKARHPRFHIGESLLPANLALFERLGVADEMRAIGIVKPAAEFVSPWHDHTQVFRFAQAWRKDQPYSYQVLRSRFDDILIRNAAAKGARVEQGCKVIQADLDDPGEVRLTARHDDGRESRWRGRFLVDASGRDTFIANKLKMKHANTRHNATAIYAHFLEARRHRGEDEGSISIFWFEQGWFWFIPLRDGVTSVGMVTWPGFLKTRGERSLHRFLLDGIASCAPLADRLRDAKLHTEVFATGNYSYGAERTHGRNYVLLGDAFAFIDPVFSSGVWLAMKGGEFAARAIGVCLREPSRAASALAQFDERARFGPKEFSWFIYRITNPTMRNLFMAPSNAGRMQEALLSMLAGDIYDGTPIWGGIRRIKFFYYLFSLLNPRRSFMSWKARRRNVRVVPGLLPAQTEY